MTGPAGPQAQTTCPPHCSCLPPGQPLRPSLAPCGFGCVCSHSPPSRPGLAAQASRLQCVLGSQAPGLRGSRHPEAWTQENPGPTPHLSHAGRLLPGPWAQHPCHLCSEQTYKHYTRGRCCPGIWRLNLEETGPPLWGPGSAGTFQERGVPRSPGTASARSGLPRPALRPAQRFWALVCGS